MRSLDLNLLIDVTLDTVSFSSSTFKGSYCEGAHGVGGEPEAQDLRPRVARLTTQRPGALLTSSRWSEADPSLLWVIPGVQENPRLELGHAARVPVLGFRVLCPGTLLLGCSPWAQGQGSRCLAQGRSLPFPSLGLPRSKVGQRSGEEPAR